MMVGAALRDAAWLTGARAQYWLRPFTLALLGCAGAALLLIGIDSVGGKPPASDFDSFWVAGRFVVAGHPALAYDNAAVDTAEHAATMMPPGTYPFYYPPTYLLLCAPLGLLGFSTALLLFITGETALILACLRRLAPRDWGWLPLLAFPGFLLNAACGQNGAFSAACFGGAAIWLEARPILAGLCLSGLVCKPQLALCVPVALLAARRFRALVACGAGALAWMALSWLLLGTGVWRGFLAHSAEFPGNIAHIAIVWPKMQSLLGAVLLAGGGIRAAIALQAISSAVALVWLLRFAIRRHGAFVEVAALATATLLFTPYLMDYDLTILSVPMACLAHLAQRDGWKPYEKAVLLAVFLLPLFVRPTALLLGVILGPPFILALLAVLWRRAAAKPAA